MKRGAVDAISANRSAASLTNYKLNGTLKQTDKRRVRINMPLTAFLAVEYK